MPQSHETGEASTRRHDYPHPEWEKDGLISDPSAKDDPGAGHFDPEATEGNGSGRRGDGDRLPDPRPDPGTPKPNGKPTSGSGNFEAPGPHFMPRELAQPLGVISVRGSEIIN